MRLIPSDPDLETIFNRIRGSDLDLQPNFQRGEVWSISKKQRLIDSVLREWHVPPIHVIQGHNGAKDEVLDGQQRLVAVRDFLNDSLRVHGLIEPIDQRLIPLHNLFFSQLPDEWKRRIRRFPIRMFSIVDYQPSEPSELFYRLNQPTALTAAEQRNSFFGKPREQIKSLADLMEQRGLDETFLGFSNARMAYDDTLSRVCIALETGLSTKTGATILADRYRSGRAFADVAVEQCARAVDLMAGIRSDIDRSFRLNKASLFSWLVFLCRMPQTTLSTVSTCAAFFERFEYERLGKAVYGNAGSLGSEVSVFYRIYNDRVKSRVADVSSVLLRDVSLWGAFVSQRASNADAYTGAVKELSSFLGNISPDALNERSLQDFVTDETVDWERVA